jgi:hypothetical protein
MLWLFGAGGIAVFVLVGLMIWAIGPCHSQHAELQYHPAYTTRTCNYYSKIGDVQTCTSWSTNHHPARCAWHTVCDVRCNEFDKQHNREKHKEHKVIQAPSISDPRCPIGAEASP